MATGALEPEVVFAIEPSAHNTDDVSRSGNSSRWPVLVAAEHTWGRPGRSMKNIIIISTSQNQSWTSGAKAQIVCKASLLHEIIHITVTSCRRIFFSLLHLLYLLCNKRSGIFRTTSLFNRLSNKMKFLHSELIFDLFLGVSQSFSLHRHSVSSSWAKFTCSRVKSTFG